MYIVERILFADMALLETEEGNLIKLKGDTSGIREGDLVTLRDGVFITDVAATERRKEAVRTRFDALKKD